MADIITKQTSNTLLIKEENVLHWNDILEKLKYNFGKDIYESWIKNINLKKEFNDYVVCQFQQDL